MKKSRSTNDTVAPRNQTTLLISQIFSAPINDQEVEARLQQLCLVSSLKRGRIEYYAFQIQEQKARRAKLTCLRDNPLRRLEGAAPPPRRLP
mgnify:CR=1 FL=1